MAREFAVWFRGRRPMTTRAVARLVAELRQVGQFLNDGTVVELQLAWWAGNADLDALRQLIIAEPRPPEETWAVLNAVQSTWPPQRTLALLDAADELGMTKGAEGPARTVRAGLLVRLQQFDEALEAIEEGLASAGQDRLLESVLLEQRGSCRRSLGREAEAAADLQRSDQIRLEMLASGDGRVIPLLQRSAHVFRQAGRSEEAAAIEQAIAEHASQSA